LVVFAYAGPQNLEFFIDFMLYFVLDESFLVT